MLSSMGSTYKHLSPYCMVSVVEEGRVQVGIHHHCLRYGERKIMYEEEGISVREGT